MKIKRNIAFLLLFGMVAALMQFWNEQNRSQAESVYSDEQIRMEMVALQEDVQPMKETTFQIVITERPEIPVRSADLKLHITMPNMFCGVFPADIVEWEPGVYSATAIPVMKGLWQAEAVLQWEDKRITVSTLFHVNG